MSLLLGKETNSKRDVFITDKQLSTHMHVIGSTGTGKSKFLEGLIRQDIAAKKGLCLIDPTGALYENLVNWIETERLSEKRKIVLFDPTEEAWTIGFNPLMSNFETSFLVDNMVKAIAKVWGGEDQDKTPLLKRCLRLILHVLAEKNLTFVEAQKLINPDDPILRNYLTHDLSDTMMREEWGFLNNRTRSQFVEDFASTRNRLMEFISSPVIRNIVGQTKSIIDFKKIMDDGEIVLVNLQPKDRLSWDNARLLGTLIVNDLFMNALARKEGAREFHLYIDECSLFLNDDIGYILDMCRKYGLHLTLAHQHLGQLRDAGEKIYRSVLTDAKTKVIFGGLEYEDADVMVKNVFMGDVELQEWKGKLTRPSVIGYNRTWFENYSKSRGSSSGTSTSESSGSGVSNGISSGQGTVYGPDGFPFGGDERSSSTFSGNSSSTSSFEVSGRGSFSSESESESEGGSEGLEPIFRDLPVETYSLEEQIWRRVALMVNQQTQHAIIKLPDKKSVFVKVPTIQAGYANTNRVRRFKEEKYLNTKFIQSVIDAAKEIEERQKRLFEGAQAQEEEKKRAKSSAGDTDFGDDEPPPGTKEKMNKKTKNK